MFRLSVCALCLAIPSAASANIKLSGRAQMRYTVEELPGEFSLPRVRLKFGGSTDYVKKASIQVDLGKGAVNLKDAYADLALGPVLLRVGQFKKPFSRQQLISSSRLAFVDRAATDKAFGAGRDLGFMLHNGKKERIEYALGLFNGYGEKGIFNPNKNKFSNLTGEARPLAVTRLAYNHGKPSGYDEVDFGGGALRVSLGLSAQHYFTQAAVQPEATYIGADMIAKVAGTSLLAEYFTGGESGVDASNGLHVQVGHLIKERYQPLLRYVQIDDAQHAMVGFSTSMKKHKLKAQVDVSQPLDDSDDGMTIRTQLQVSF
jgi:hypothetical protein